jgi:hypothetical protein
MAMEQDLNAIAFPTLSVRSGSVKRVASAVGEGSMSVQFVHEFLKGM